MKDKNNNDGQFRQRVSNLYKENEAIISLGIYIAIIFLQLFLCNPEPLLNILNMSPFSPISFAFLSYASLFFPSFYIAAYKILKEIWQDIKIPPAVK